MLKIALHIFIVSVLTLVTQIGGIIWILNFGFYKIKKSKKSRLLRTISFIVFYVIITLFIIPRLAQVNNRTALPFTKSSNLVPHNYLTPLLNRHYVKPALKADLIDISNQMHSNNQHLKLSYLDANFPFLNGFPLLPHLSHNDGRKIDLSFYYTKRGTPGNLKPANMGYGKFVEPTATEFNQTEQCKAKGYWHYDYTKYLTLGTRDDLVFDSENTKSLILSILQMTNTQKLLIEPHLKKRMKLTNDKIRFQGCRAVRHDDHIHYQIN